MRAKTAIHNQKTRHKKPWHSTMKLLTSFFFAIILLSPLCATAGVAVAYSDNGHVYGLSFAQTDMRTAVRTSLFQCSQKTKESCRAVYHGRAPGFGAIAQSDTAIFVSSGFPDEETAVDKVKDLCRQRKHECIVMTRFYDPVTGNDVLERSVRRGSSLAPRAKRNDQDQ